MSKTRTSRGQIYPHRANSQADDFSRFVLVSRILRRDTFPHWHGRCIDFSKEIKEVLASGPSESIIPPVETPPKPQEENGSIPFGPEPTQKYDPVKIEKALKERIRRLIEQKNYVSRT